MAIDERENTVKISVVMTRLAASWRRPTAPLPRRRASGTQSLSGAFVVAFADYRFYRCSRDTLGAPCRVLARAREACAYCKVGGKSVSVRSDSCCAAQREYSIRLYKDLLELHCQQHSTTACACSCSCSSSCYRHGRRRRRLHGRCHNRRQRPGCRPIGKDGRT
jgi:hypothetical protein